MIAIDAIVIGDRVRQDVGDIGALAESIRTVGLLHPPVIDGEDRLVCGFRRIQAMKRLGWTETPVTYAKSADDRLAALLAERDENTCRADFTPEEMVVVARQIRVIEEAAAKERHREGSGTRSSPGSEKSSEPVVNRRSGETRERVARAVGVSHQTLRKAEKVIEAAEADPDPIVRQVAERARTEMNQTSLAAATTRRPPPLRASRHSSSGEGRPAHRNTVRQRQPPRSARWSPARSNPPQTPTRKKKRMTNTVDPARPQSTVDMLRLVRTASNPPPKAKHVVRSEVQLRLDALTADLAPGEWACVFEGSAQDAAKLQARLNTCRKHYEIALRLTTVWVRPKQGAR